MAPSSEERLTVGQLLRPSNITKDTFTELDTFDAQFITDDAVEHPGVIEWFRHNFVGISETEYKNKILPSDFDLLNTIRERSATDEKIQELMTATTNPISSKIKEAMSMYSVSDGLLYQDGKVVVPDNEDLKVAILKTYHDSKLAGHPGRAKTLSLI